MKTAIIVLAVLLTLPGALVLAQEDPPCTDEYPCEPPDPDCTDEDCPPDPDCTDEDCDEDPPCTNGDCDPTDPPCTNGDCDPQDDTPANEGVCDDLKWATPGLYGLCIAFCEAQDCEMDFSLEDPFENCKPSSEKLLRNYNRKKTELDPEMPCIQKPCPCWTQEQADALRYQSSDPSEIWWCDSSDSPQDFWVIESSVSVPSYFTVMVAGYLGSGPAPLSCLLIDVCSDSYECSQTSVAFEVTPQEWAICLEQVIAAGIDRGLDCWN